MRLSHLRCGGLGFGSIGLGGGAIQIELLLAGHSLRGQRLGTFILSLRLHRCGFGLGGAGFGGGSIGAGVLQIGFGLQ